MNPNIVNGDTPMPSGPPVHCDSLLITIEMMMPRPSVAMASVWPLSFRIGRATTKASTPVAAAPTTSATIGGQPMCVVSAAEAYAPMP